MLESIQAVDGNIPALLLGTAFALLVWMLRKLYNAHVAERLTKLATSIEVLDTRLDVLERNYPTHDDITELKESIADMRRGNRDDMAALQRQIAGLIQHLLNSRHNDSGQVS